MDNDYYKILEIDKNASADEIKSAYRRLAKKWHPDIYATDKEEKKKLAKEKFTAIQHAYSVLSDPQKKAAYDQYGSEDGPMGAQGFGGGGFSSQGFGGFGDIFGDIFSAFGGGSRQQSRNAPRIGEDIEIQIDLTFNEMFFGGEKEISYNRIENCTSCKGTGAKNGNAYTICDRCRGTGVITVDQRTMLGVMRTQQACPNCGGKGKIIKEKCSDCGGTGRVKKIRTVNVKIPAGVDTNQMLTVPREGNAGYNGAEKGNLILIFVVMPHKLFKRERNDLFMDYPITVSQAILGDTVEIPTMTGNVKIEIPEGTQEGTVLRIKRRGVKDLRRDMYGDLFVKITIDIPKNLSPSKKKIIKESLENLEKAKYDKIDKFNKTIKSL